MADDVVICAEGLGKKYMIGHAAERERYVALRDVLARGARNLQRSAMDLLRGRPMVAGDEVEEFWALKDINFEIRRGEVVGVIGRNGAGKSTLLKILSRITEPSEGRVTIHGRVASLLEVGTGFHPELTGRENIYLNGAILGMSRAELRNKFDEIIAFAEVEKFLDTPVKRYSSGMYVRLAFAIAAHLEPEILVIDEVLAVGDIAFQRKCLGKMGEVAAGGRTVLFVSHNLASISALCPNSALLVGGQLSYFGSSDTAIANYLGDSELGTPIRGRHISVSGSIRHHGEPDTHAHSIVIHVRLIGPLSAPRLGVGINSPDGNRLCTLFSETSTILPPVGAGHEQSFTFETEPLRLTPGLLIVKIALANNDTDIEVFEDAFRLLIPDYMPFEHPPRAIPRGVFFAKSVIHQHD